MPTRDEQSQVRAIVRDVRRLTERAVINITLRVTRELKFHTPVDTGWARANWIPAVGAPQPAPVGTRGNAGAAVAAATTGQTRVLGYRLNRGKTFVTNNVPYIQRLNIGHSRQEPAGFVQRAIRQGVIGATRGR